MKELAYSSLLLALAATTAQAQYPQQQEQAYPQQQTQQTQQTVFVETSQPAQPAQPAQPVAVQPQVVQPAAQPAQVEEPRRARIGAYLAAGLGGQATAEQGGFSGDADMDPTIGVGVRLELPMGSVFTLSPFAEFDAYKLDGATGRDLGIDAGLMFRFGTMLNLGSMNLELYGGLPVGFTAYLPDDGSLDTMLGFNVGALGGVQLHVTKSVAVMVELGWQMHRVYEDDVSLMGNQAKMQIGAMFFL